MLRNAVSALWRRIRGVSPQRSGGLGFWLYPEGPGDQDRAHSPIVVLFYEWSHGGVTGLTFADFWFHSDDAADFGRKLEGEALPVFEDAQSVAELIDRGRLVRIGSAPVLLRRNLHRTPKLGSWG